MFSKVSPEPSSQPSEKFRDCVELQVRIKSPAPAKPDSVSGLAPLATPNLTISAKPLVTIAAREFSPKPLPFTIPQAIAITFFTAPPIWAPITSRDRYILKCFVVITSINNFPNVSSSVARVIAVGRSSATSIANVGPDKIATRTRGIVSLTISLIKELV